MRSGRGASSGNGRRERHRTDVSRRLCTAALDLFAEVGIDQTRVVDITNAADVGKGTFFNYFDSKEHLAVHLMERMRGFALEALAAARDGTMSARDILRSLACRKLEGSYGTRPFNLSLALTLIQEPKCGENLADYMAKTTRELFVEILTIFQQRGEIRTDCPPDVMAEIYHNAQLGRWFQWCLQSTDTLAEAQGVGADQLWLLLRPRAEPKREAQLLPIARTRSPRNNGSRRRASAPR